MSAAAAAAPGGLGNVHVLRPPAPARLPALRNELRLMPAARQRDGTPAWMIHDPVVNRFYRIGWLDFELLLRWEQGTARQLAASVSDETTLAADEADVMALLQFLGQHQLLAADGTAAVDRLRERAKLQRQGPLGVLLHHYLYFRVPLVRPQQALQRLLAVLGWLYTPATAITVALLGALGLFLAARQWDTFTATFVDQLSWSGLAGYTLALCGAKLLHELGHALTATRHGVRVPHMGVAFLVMFPMLYTDTSESWKLQSARARLSIASAGIVAELALAGLATLAWSLAPDGALRNALYFLATTSWLLTLAVNASPFMRFDGYFMLMDWLDFPNLHERAGVLARTWLRRLLLGTGEAYPERLPARTHAALTAFALATWLYRLVVFLGIALLVYHYFFKLLGIVLMVVELAWFIARPVAAELRVWHARRGDVAPRRRLAALLLAALALAALLLPWAAGVHGAGYVRAQRQQVIHAPLAAQLVALPAGTQAGPGQRLFELMAPELALSGERAQVQAEARAQELVGLAGLPGGEERRALVQSQQERFDAEARLYRDEGARLSLAAPFAGVLADVDPRLAPGAWVQPRQALATLIDPSRWVVETFVAEVDVARVRAGQPARVYVRSQGLAPLTGRVIEVDANRSAVLPHRLLDAQAGGPIATLPATVRDAAPVPREALYRVTVALDAPPAAQRVGTAHVVIEADRRAWLPAWLERGAAVLVRESGF